MITDFNKIRLLAACIARDYAEDLLRLLHLYNDISASEAASRLSMHIRTVQEFFDALYESGVLHKEEVFESKRPYFRYRLISEKISIELDLAELDNIDTTDDKETIFIREQKNANARFSTSRNNLFFSSVSIWIGEGRERSEKKVNLTTAQGRFLFNLPFPDADFLSVEQIMQKAAVNEEHRPEIMDIVNLLIEHNVIEVK